MADYDGPDRRSLHIEHIADCMDEALDQRLPHTESALIAHANAKTAEVLAAVNTLNAKIDGVLEASRQETARQIKVLRDEAFPDGPLYRHKDFHDGRIRQAERDDKIRTDLTAWAWKGVLTVVGAMLLLGFIEWFKRELNK